MMKGMLTKRSLFRKEDSWQDPMGRIAILSLPEESVSYVVCQGFEETISPSK